MASQKQIDLVLIGKTGNGKSATGNSILMRKVFKSNFSTTSVTKIAQYEVCKFEDRVIKVVDAPGTNDTDSSKSEALTLVTASLTQAMLTNPQGFHAFLIVVKFGQRFTKEEQSAIQILKGILGQNFLQDFGILVMCNGDDFAEESDHVDFKQFCCNQKGPFQDILKECKNRIVLFDNKTVNEATKSQQVKSLITIVDALPNGGKRYTNEHFKQAEKERNIMYLNSLVPMIEIETLNTQRLILDEIKLVENETCEKNKIISLEKILPKVEKLIKEIEMKDKGTGALRKLLENVDGTRKTVKEQIQSNSTIIKVNEEIRVKEEALKNENSKNIKQIREKLEKEKADAIRRQEEEKRRLQCLLDEQEKIFTEIKEEADSGFFSKAVDIFVSVGKGVATAAGTIVCATGGAAGGFLVGTLQGIAEGFRRGDPVGLLLFTPVAAIVGAVDGAVTGGALFVNKMKGN